jgi:hypothetical protein
VQRVVWLMAGVSAGGAVGSDRGADGGVRDVAVALLHAGVARGTGDGRATPDVSADADPFTGCEIYDPMFNGAALEGGWGGTSFVAPQLNGAAAVIDQYVGHRLGLWNPSIYRFAGQPGSPFTPLGASGTSNDNLYYTGTRGQTYNVGSGLGTPDLSRLAADFARQTDRAAQRH